MSRVVLHIDRLVLRGIAPEDAATFAEALQAELQQRLAADGGLAALQGHERQARYRPAPIRLAPHTSSEQFGQAVASQLLPTTERGAP
ncbi:hypothetical protein LRS11_16565 [Pseudomonas sp. J452]|uniref:hypothetical protein n=1 Tax=Pseudomonas sp. J452 TaxID=2898441 RepID=UPI0021ADC56E|nr:hypothetical protein [Pseudomonas sp. J452]UUY07428.1 hypothetical protein LRS11_16565 [Pseudomonas sp. J452]